MAARRLRASRCAARRRVHACMTRAAARAAESILRAESPREQRCSTVAAAVRRSLRRASTAIRQERRSSGLSARAYVGGSGRQRAHSGGETPEKLEEGLTWQPIRVGGACDANGLEHASAAQLVSDERGVKDVWLRRRVGLYAAH
eukprot:scaffold300900_cov26-Tisochrysis_lutea.AAC.5